MSLSLPIPHETCGAYDGRENVPDACDSARVRVAVSAATGSPLPQYARLLRALESLFPVTFVRESGNGATADAALCLGTDTGLWPAHGPVFQVAGGEFIGLSKGELRFAAHGSLPEAFRGLALHDPSCRIAHRLRPDAACSVLAAFDGHPVWLCALGRPLHFVSALPLPQLEEHEGLYAHFRPAAWAALLPLLHWLRQVSQPEWQLPPPRAAIVIDDPNLRRSCYGELDFARLAAVAAHDNFHTAIATIPLDADVGGLAAAAAFRSSRGRLSLLVHGNNHTRNELAQRAPAECRRTVAQARERIARLEQRSGLKVDRVMAAPHGACSPQMASELSAGGYAAALISIGSLLRWNPELAAEPALGLLPAWMWNGLPVLHRHGLRYVSTQMALSRFLGQAAIFTAHHGDCGHGLELLREVAWTCNVMAPTQWMSAAALARSNFLLRHHGNRLEVRMFARRVSVPLAFSPSHAIVTLPHAGSVHFDPGKQGLFLLGAGRMLAAARTATTLELEILTLPVAPRPYPVRAWVAPWARARRGLCEVRDRLSPFFATLSQNPSH